MLLCEVKSSPPALSFNERLRTDPRALDSALRWSGLIPPERLKETVDRLLPLLQDGATIDEVRAGVEVDGVRIRVLLCCPGCDSEPEPPRWCVRGAAMLDYINRCLNPRAPREKCSTRYSFKLWGGFLAPLVEYVKSLPSTNRHQLLTFAGASPAQRRSGYCVRRGVQAAPLHSCKYRRLRAPATKDTCRERSSESDDLFVCTVAPSIAARLLRSSI